MLLRVYPLKSRQIRIIENSLLLIANDKKTLKKKESTCTAQRADTEDTESSFTIHLSSSSMRKGQFSEMLIPYSLYFSIKLAVLSIFHELKSNTRQVFVNHKNFMSLSLISA